MDSNKTTTVERRFLFSYFQNHQAYQSKLIDVQELVRLIKYDNYVRVLTEQYRDRAYRVSVQSANDDIKDRVVPVFSVGVLFNGAGKQLSHITEFTGLVFCDIDHIPDIDEAFRKCRDDRHTFLVYRTLSGEGLRVICRFQRTDGEPHLNGEHYAVAFRKGNSYYAGLTGHAYDTNCCNVNRMSTIAHDEEVYLNTEAEPFRVTEEELLEAGFSQDRMPGKTRKEYPQGACKATPEEAWQAVRSLMDRRGLCFEPHRHHEYVLHAAYAFNLFGCAEDDLLVWADQEWAGYDREERHRTIRWVYRKYAARHGVWKVGRAVKSSDSTMASIDDICQWLYGHHVTMVYNEVTDQTLYRQRDDGEWRQVDNRVLCSLRKAIAKDLGKRVLRSDVQDVVQSDYARLVHPVREYLGVLPPWDGTDRVAELAGYVAVEPVQEGQTAAEAQEEMRWALHKWLVASVAMWMSDGMSNHGIFVLIGPQGIYKTTFFRHLLPPDLRGYFWENSHNSFSAKDDHLALSENCLVEIEEIDMSRERDISELKALATSVSIKERRPYARFREAKHRLASFCASGNQQRFLSDETGNRRWLCFKVSAIENPLEWRIDYTQLYAQLRDEYQHGFRYWFDLSDQRRVERQNAAFRIESDEEQLIRSRLRVPGPGDPVRRMSSADICKLLNGGFLTHGLSSRKVSLVMQKLGFKLEHTRAGNYFCIYEVPPNQVQSHISSEMAKDVDSELVMKEGDLPF